MGLVASHQGLVAAELYCMRAGAVYSRGGVAQVGSDMVCPFQDKLSGPLLRNTEGLLVAYKGDGNSYTLQLTTEGGHTYTNKFTAALGYSSARLPFNTFIPEGDAPPLNPGLEPEYQS